MATNITQNNFIFCPSVCIEAFLSLCIFCVPTKTEAKRTCKHEEMPCKHYWLKSNKFYTVNLRLANSLLNLGSLKLNTF